MGALLQTTLAQQPMPLISHAVAAVLFSAGYFCNISWLSKYAMKTYLGVLACSTVMLIGSEPVDGAVVFQLSPMQLQLCCLALGLWAVPLWNEGLWNPWNGVWRFGLFSVCTYPSGYPNHVRAADLFFCSMGDACGNHKKELVFRSGA